MSAGSRQRRLQTPCTTAGAAVSSDRRDEHRDDRELSGPDVRIGRHVNLRAAAVLRTCASSRSSIARSFGVTIDRGHVRRAGPPIRRPRLGGTVRGQIGVRQMQQQQRIARLRRGGLAEEGKCLLRTSQRDEDLSLRVEQGGVGAEFRDGPRR